MKGRRIPGTHLMGKPGCMYVSPYACTGAALVCAWRAKVGRETLGNSRNQQFLCPVPAITI